MNGRATTLITAALAAAIVALTLYSYRELFARPFAADDYQWLLNVRGLSLGTVARNAFDPGAQSHFYRPLIWLLFWAQTRAFGIDPRGFHAVSLALHLLNAFLLGWLAYRLTNDQGRTTNDETRYSWSFVLGRSSALVAIAIVALHPAPFEAVVWISAQSELLAAALLLAALHLWLCRRTANDERRMTNEESGANPRFFVVRPWSILATLMLSLALLTKESAVIGLPLLMLLGRRSGDRRQETGSRIKNQESRIKNQVSTIRPYILPTLLTLAYVGLQVAIERRNYLLAQGGYGIGPQLVLNPLRSLALLVAPLAGSEHADAAWLAPVGALLALMLLGFMIYDLRLRLGQWGRSSVVHHLSSAGLVLALALTLLPTAPFSSPPDSRYLYLPVMVAALLVIFAICDLQFTMKSRHRVTDRRGIVFGSLFFVLALSWWASGELHAREGRFAAASGPAGSLWRVASAVCAESHPDRMVIVDPPLAPPHAEAIVGLACGDATRAKIVGREQVTKAIKGHTVVIAFPNGSAEIEQRT
jgi:hypothetical protein